MHARIFSLVVAFLCAMFPPAIAAPAEVCETLGVESYDLEISGLRRTYPIGGRFEVTVGVSRKGTGTPVEGARTFVGLAGEDRFFVAVGETDENGEAVLSGSLRRARAGRYDFLAYAYTGIDTTCAGVQEYGQEFRKRAVMIHQ
jgi:hypothetical protein